MSLNSDSDELARRLYWEAAKAVKYGGVSEAEALKMVTLNPARQLGSTAGRLHRGGQGRRPRGLQRPPLLAGRARRDTLVDGTVYFDRARDLAPRGVSTP